MHTDRTLQRTSLGLALALGAWLAGCAQTPTQPATQVAAADCAALEAQLETAGQAQRRAEQRQHDAWKAVAPLAVVARYGHGMAEAHASSQRLAELQRQAALRGCAVPTN